MVVEASDIRFHKVIGKQTLFTSAPRNQVMDADIYKLPFKLTPGHYLPHQLPGRLVEQDCFLQFAIKNSADTAITICFIPGSYCRSISLFKAQMNNIPATLTRLPDSLINDNRNAGVKRIYLQPHEQALFFSRFNFVRTNVNALIPRLIMDDYVKQWGMLQRERDGMLDVFTYTVSGVLLFMIFFHWPFIYKAGTRNLSFMPSTPFLPAPYYS
ncbi:hypothetical protein [Niastella yeongjuensis]|nr:hypothetical protein [Niastella yeongjuensis]